MADSKSHSLQPRTYVPEIMGSTAVSVKKNLAVYGSVQLSMRSLSGVCGC